MRLKIFLPLFIILLLATPANFALAQERALEVDYPEIPGVPTPVSTSVALPDYVNYIFRFAVMVIGFIILGLLIYAGFIYLTSGGSPARLTEARRRVFAGFLGGVILLGAFIIFRTINPQLVGLVVDPLLTARANITPGIYFCGGQIDNKDELKNDIDNYANGDANTTVNAAKKITKVMTEKRCQRMVSSGNFEAAVNANESRFFSIPSSRVDDNGQLKYDVYEYGLILHESDNRRGRCALVTENGDTPYSAIDFDPNFDFQAANSFTLFKKLPEEQKPRSEDQGAILYSCPDYKNSGTCNTALFSGDTTAKLKAFPLGGKEMNKINDLGEFKENVRSVKFDPSGKVFAVFEGGSDFIQGEKCEVINSDDANLLDNSIGRCGAQCLFVTRWDSPQVMLAWCTPCPTSMIVIEGQVL